MLKRVNLFIVLIILLVMLTPILNRNVPRTIEIGLFGIWVLITLLSLKFKWIIKNGKVILGILLWQMLEFFYKFIGVSTAEYGNYMIGLFSYMLVIVGLYINEEYSIKQKRLLVIFIVALVLFNVIDNIRLNDLYQGATNDIYQEWASYLLLLNVAETGFYGANMMMIGGLLIYLSYASHYFERILIIVSIVVSLYFCFFISPRATSCAFIIIEFIYIFFKRKQALRRYWIGGLLLLPVICVFILPYTSSFSDDTMGDGFSRIIERVTSVNDAVHGNKDDESSFGARVNFTTMSINTFLDSPSNFLFGVGHHLDENGWRYGIGQHTRYADVLANYGILGGFSLLYLTVLLYRRYRSIMHKHWDVWKIVFIVYVLYGCVEHNRNVGMVIMLMIFAPSVYSLINEIKK